MVFDVTDDDVASIPSPLGDFVVLRILSSILLAHEAQKERMILC